ncbi:MAG TPA: flagellar hook-basal body complex protein [Ramlibacter sp.]|uniref:flagellar hook protein FlgE n=1 Tax=Ramlibacter sp. TaxID=1917967 RepID=UPI002ED3611B
MLDSIQIGVTGLAGYQQGLRVIANNTANLNTPGYKSSTLQFADLFYSASPGGGRSDIQLGHGLDTTGTQLNFRPGDLRQTGNDFDLALDGEGLFALRDAQGQMRYTRAGLFEFNGDGIFVNRADGSKVLARDASDKLVEVSIAGLRTSAGKATSSGQFNGNLSSTLPEHTVSGLKVFDAVGGEHALSLKFTNTASETPGSWKVELLEGTTSLGSAELVFVDGRPSAATNKLVFTYTPSGQAAQQLAFTFGADVTSFAAGNLSTLALATQDGYAPGNLAKVVFDAAGTLVATYSNGQTVKGPRLALGRFSSPDAVKELGGNLFAEAGGMAWQIGSAGEGGFGSVKAGMLEGSNVDLSREFSDLVVMQRGYQASSQVISTANDMLQELFGMKRK